MFASHLQEGPAAFGNHTPVESRVLQLESVQRSVLQGFESIASQLKELGRKLHDQPSATALHGTMHGNHVTNATTSDNFQLLAQRFREIGDVFQDMQKMSLPHSSAGQLQSFPEFKSGAHADDGFRNWDERLRTVEDRVSEKLRNVEDRVSERFRTMEDGVAESFRILEDRALKGENKVTDMEVGIAHFLQSSGMKGNFPLDSKVDKTAHNYFASSSDATYTKSYMDAKHNTIDNVRLPEAVNNSYHEYTSNQRNWHPLARTFNEHLATKGFNKSPFDEWRADTGRIDSPRQAPNNGNSWDAPFSSTWVPRPPSGPQSRPESPAFHRRFDNNTMSGNPTDLQRRLDQMGVANIGSPYHRRSPERC